jgi:hypothetical protein
MNELRAKKIASIDSELRSWELRKNNFYWFWEVILCSDSKKIIIIIENHFTEELDKIRENQEPSCVKQGLMSL